jgi:adenylylsulfate kinase-like enzyme
MKKKKYIFWITGLSGSGKTTIGKAILPQIRKKFGNTILINGDNIREIYDFKKFDKTSRLKLAKSNFDLCFFLVNQGCNIIFTTVGLMHELQNYNRKIGKSKYIEIFIEADIKKIIKKKSKFFYRKKTNNVVGLNIKPEFPKKPDIKIENKFNMPIKEIKEILLKKIISKF